MQTQKLQKSELNHEKELNQLKQIITEKDAVINLLSTKSNLKIKKNVLLIIFIKWTHRFK